MCLLLQYIFSIVTLLGIFKLPTDLTCIGNILSKFCTTPIIDSIHKNTLRAASIERIKGTRSSDIFTGDVACQAVSHISDHLIYNLPSSVREYECIGSFYQGSSVTQSRFMSFSHFPQKMILSLTVAAFFDSVAYVMVSYHCLFH